jgi:hypothetical protein
LNPIPTETGLLVAAVVPVAVIGWAMLFSVEAARRGPAWALRHLAMVSTVLKMALVLGAVAILVVRPIWIGLGIAYPLAVALLLVVGRQRQLGMIEREIGFGEVQSDIRDRLLAKLRRGLIVVGGISLVVGFLLASVGVVQAWVLGSLAPIAGLALVRSKSGQVGSALPPSL